MANIIIRPEHQSAPKEPARIIQSFNPSPAQGPAPWESYDREMDAGPCMQSNDPGAAAMIRKMREQSLLQERLDAVEEAQRQFEKTAGDVRLKETRWEGQERWQGRENEEMRLVRIMHAHTFIEKFARAGIPASVVDPHEWYRENTDCLECGSKQKFHIGPSLRCSALDERGTNWKPDLANWPKPTARLWLNSFSRAGRVGICAMVNGEIMTVTTVQYPYGPEYSIMRFDEYNVPTNERYRGWRTALLQLIVANVITEEEAERVFGPALGPAGAFYRKQLFEHRSLRYGVKQ